MVLAMIDWVENGVAPDVIIGAKYVGDDKRNGTLLERPHCVCVSSNLRLPNIAALSLTRPARPQLPEAGDLHRR